MGKPPGSSCNQRQIQYHFPNQRNNCLHCFIWNAEKTPKQPVFHQAPWVCWGTCNTYLASLAGTTPKSQLSHLLVTKEEKEASSETAVHRSSACRVAIGTWPCGLSCLCLHLTLFYTVTTHSTVFGLWKRLQSSTGGGSSGEITVLLPTTGSNTMLDTYSTSNKCAWFPSLNLLILSDLNSVQAYGCFEEKFASEYIKIMLYSIYFCLT